MQTKASLQNAVTEREKKNQTLAFEAAAESIVLLENDGVLPISPCKTALFGAGAAYTIQGGSGSGEVNVRHAVTVLEGLEKAGRYSPDPFHACFIPGRNASEQGGIRQSLYRSCTGADQCAEA